MGSDSIPQSSFGWEYKPRSSLCTHAFHHMDSKDPDIHVLDGWMPTTKAQAACAIHEDWIWLPQRLNYKWSHMQKYHQKWFNNPRYIAGDARKEKKKDGEERNRQPSTFFVKSQQVLRTVGSCWSSSQYLYNTGMGIKNGKVSWKVGAWSEAPWNWSFLTKLRRKNCLKQPCIFQFCQFLTWCKTITF